LGERWSVGASLFSILLERERVAGVVGCDTSGLESGLDLDVLHRVFSFPSYTVGSGKGFALMLRPAREDQTFSARSASEREQVARQLGAEPFGGRTPRALHALDARPGWWSSPTSGSTRSASSAGNRIESGPLPLMCCLPRKSGQRSTHSAWS